MNKSAVVAFVMGATVGSVVTWRVLKEKYARQAQEEIDSYKEYCASRDEKSDIPEYEHSEEDVIAKVDSVEQVGDGIKVKVSNPKPSIVDYVKKVEEAGYIDYSAMSNKKVEIEERAVKKPYVISPDEFGDNEDYQQISLTYFEDQVLADDNNEIVEDIEGTVGFEALTSFGQWEDDAVHVRNERLKCDYEILKDLRLYSNVIEK